MKISILKALCLTLTLILTNITPTFAAETNPAPEKTPEQIAADKRATDFNTKLKSLPRYDAKAHYALGEETFSPKELDTIDLATKALKIAAGTFNITLPDGSSVTYRFDDSDKESDTWTKIIADKKYSDPLISQYQAHLSADKKLRKKINELKNVTPKDYNAKTRWVVLNKIAKAHEKELTQSFPVTPVYKQALKQYDLYKDAHETLNEKLNPDIWLMIFGIIGGLGIFLIGMKNLSDGMQAVAGSRLRKMINAVTDNRFMATGVGTGVTCLVQSSSITTVIVIGLVNSGLMLLHQAIGVIMGANVGTTITGWILAVKIGKYGLPILGIAAFVYLFAKKDKLKYFAMAVFGLGMVFFGLSLMKDGFSPIKQLPEFKAAFDMFRATDPQTGNVVMYGVLMSVLIGAVLTGIVQSSSATLGITIAIASQGGMDYQTAVALVLGQNIGTTITAFLASIGTTTIARRAAYFHIFFNIVGVILITPFFGPYVDMIANIIHSYGGTDPRYIDVNKDANFPVAMTVGIATAHTIFNIVMTIIMLPFVKQFAATLEKLVPDKAAKLDGHHLKTLDIRMVESPMLGIETSRGEIINMGSDVAELMNWGLQLIKQEDPDEKLTQKFFDRDQQMDVMQQEVIDFVSDILTGNVPLEITIEGRQQIRIADELESISDYMTLVLKSRLKLIETGAKLSDPKLLAIEELHAQTANYIQFVIDSFADNNDQALDQAETLGKAITEKTKELRDAHLVSLTEKKIDPLLSMTYTSMLNGYRKIKDHALNIAETVAHH